MSKARLQIGLNKANQLVSVFDVETGEKCDCTCPECGAKLVAKNRSKKYNEPLKKGKKIAHFSHANSADCPGAPETAIHLLAKQVLAENKRLLIPSISKESVDLSKPKLIEFDEVFTEQFVIKNNVKIQPDSILVIRGKQLYIEFYKTHFVDDLKIDKIKTLNTSCIEIDLTNIEPLKDGKLNKEEIRQLLEEDLFSKKWLHNSQAEKLYSDFIVKEKAKEEQRKKDLIEQERIQQLRYEKERAQEIEEKKRIDNLKKLGYDFLKVYEFVKYDYNSYHNEHTGRYKTYKSIISKEENVYCPKDKVQNKNKRIDLFDCKYCEFHNSIIEGDDYDKSIVCGFRIKLKDISTEK